MGETVADHVLIKIVVLNVNVAAKRWVVAFKMLFKCNIVAYLVYSNPYFFLFGSIVPIEQLLATWIAKHFGFWMIHSYWRKSRTMPAIHPISLGLSLRGASMDPETKVSAVGGNTLGASLPPPFVLLSSRLSEGRKLPLCGPIPEPIHRLVMLTSAWHSKRS